MHLDWKLALIPTSFDAEPKTIPTNTLIPKRRIQDLVEERDLQENTDPNLLLLIRTSYNHSNHSWTPSTSEAFQAALPSATESSGFKSVTLQQVYILFWPCVLYIAMLGIALTFIMKYRGYNNSMLGLKWTEASMQKEDALVMIFCYAACGWAMSNGLILNSGR